jgi:hypothetical protein
MKKYFVTVVVMDTIEVEATSRDEAAELALEIFNPDFADGPSVHDVWEDEGEEMLDALIAEYEEDERVKALENFDPITHIEAQERTGEMK